MGFIGISPNQNINNVSRIHRQPLSQYRFSLTFDCSRDANNILFRNIFRVFSKDSSIEVDWSSVARYYHPHIFSSWLIQILRIFSKQGGITLQPFLFSFLIFTIVIFGTYDLNGWNIIKATIILCTGLDMYLKFLDCWRPEMKIVDGKRSSNCIFFGQISAPTTENPVYAFNIMLIQDLNDYNNVCA